MNQDQIWGLLTSAAIVGTAIFGTIGWALENEKMKPPPLWKIALAVVVWVWSFPLTYALFWRWVDWTHHHVR